MCIKMLDRCIWLYSNLAFGLVFTLAATVSQEVIVDEIIEMYEQAMEEADLFEGDIMIIHSGIRNIDDMEKYLWPDATIPYVIDESLFRNLSVVSIIEDAMEYYHENTCVRFVQRTYEREYIKIHNGKGCFATLGRNKTYTQPLLVSLGRGCHVIGTVLHELGHVLGVPHEHNRSDRDEYLTIYHENVKKGKKSNFEKVKSSEEILYTVFDYDSIMIYGNYAFSRDPKSLKTMEAHNGKKLFSPYKKKSLTKSDIERVNNMYKCPILKKL